MPHCHQVFILEIVALPDATLRNVIFQTRNSRSWKLKMRQEKEEEQQQRNRCHLAGFLLEICKISSGGRKDRKLT